MDTRKLLHKALQHAPDHGVFQLRGCLHEAMGNPNDDDKSLRQFGPVLDEFLSNYGDRDPAGHSEFFILNDSGRRFKAQRL